MVGKTFTFVFIALIVSGAPAVGFHEAIPVFGANTDESHLKNRILVQTSVLAEWLNRDKRGGDGFQPAGLLMSVEDLKPITNSDNGPKDAFERTSSKQVEQLFEAVGIQTVPEKMPPVEIALPDPEGRIVSISEFKNKIVFVNFWTTWCFACIIEMPAMERLHKKFKDRGFVMIAINLQESAATVKRFFKEHNLTFRALLDTKGLIGIKFGIRSIPTTYILDKRGRIIGKALGPREWDGDKAMALFDYLVEKTDGDISQLIQ